MCNNINRTLRVASGQEEVRKVRGAILAVTATEPCPNFLNLLLVNMDLEGWYLRWKYLEVMYTTWGVQRRRDELWVCVCWGCFECFLMLGILELEEMTWRVRGCANCNSCIFYIWIIQWRNWTSYFNGLYIC